MMVHRRQEAADRQARLLINAAQHKGHSGGNRRVKV